MGGRPERKLRDVPDYWTALSDENKVLYDALRKRIKLLAHRTTHDQLPIKFQAIVSEIRQYSMQQKVDDWRRCLVCGIAWLSGGALAISSRQLCKLIGKCKSSINAGFQSLGYVISPMTSKQASELMTIFPFLLHHCSEVRQWTIRAPVGNGAPPRASGDNLEGHTESERFRGSLDAYEPSCELFQEQDLYSPEWDDSVMIPSEQDGVADDSSVP
jgi:hypothetical protein